MTCYTSGYLVSGTYSHAIGINNKASGYGVASGYSTAPSIQNIAIESEIKNFLKENLNLIEINNFDSLYDKFSNKWEAPSNAFLISELHKMLEGCGI